MCAKKKCQSRKRNKEPQKKASRSPSACVPERPRSRPTSRQGRPARPTLTAGVTWSSPGWTPWSRPFRRPLRPRQTWRRTCAWPLRAPRYSRPHRPCQTSTEPARHWLGIIWPGLQPWRTPPRPRRPWQCPTRSSVPLVMLEFKRP